MSNLRSILGVGKVKKRKSATARPRASPAPAPTSSWASSLPRTKNATASGKKTAPATRNNDDGDDDYFHDRLDDVGLVQALATDMTLRDVVQAIRYTRNCMFDEIPQTGAGMNGTKIADVLNYRKALPPAATMGHVQALLSSPTAAEREAAELERAGVIRRVVVPRRGGIGDVLVLGAELEAMVKGSASLDEATKDAFLGWLKANPTGRVMPRNVDGLAAKQTDGLVRAGFLTAQHNGLDAGAKFTRPEDRSTMISLDTIAGAASGSLAAVGGAGAIHAAGGTGAGWGGYGGVAQTGLWLAVPGNGIFLKLISAALEHLESLLERAQFRELPETDLRERWEGGIVGDREAALAKKTRGEFVGVLPGRTKKWREFNGLSFTWVLHEAVGAGLVEVFETRSVGRGVRLL
ncbi:hypothetical protein GQ53DRAFT_371195 [Thozetella sp. PMI_491]|nr:hypothetical protein GQ53DRAFT_371195 [Thozetella sp. PMI_491]